MSMIQKLTKASRRSVPIVGISTPDQVACTETIKTYDWSQELGEAGGTINIITYDVVRGFSSVPDNIPDEFADAKSTKCRANISNALNVALHFPSRTIIIFQNAQEFIHVPAVQQAIQNLRNEFKRDRRMLILLGSFVRLTENIRNDVVLLDEDIPDRDKIAGIIVKMAKNVGMSDYTASAEEIDAVHGLPSFQAEQALALGLTRNEQGDTEFCLPTVWSLKKQLIETTRGLSVWNGGDKFDTLGGLQGIKDDLRLLFNGPKPPQVIVWLDEIEKSAIASTGDSNGINSDMLGVMLSYMEDKNVIAKCYVGSPGTGKSQAAKSAGGEFNRLVIRMDLGAMKDSYVGNSEANVRSALRLISAVGGDNALFIATSNSIEKLDTALQARFSDVFFFDLPTVEELEPIWDIQKAKYNVTEQEIPDDTFGWVGRNIKQCCEKAYRHGMTLQEASRYIIPTGISAKNDIEKLRNAANGKFLSANTGLIYSV